MIRARRLDPTDRRAATVLVAALVASALALLLVVSSSGSVEVWSEPPPGELPAFEPTEGLPADGPSVGQGERPAPPPEAPNTWWTKALAVVLGLLLVRWAWIVISFWAQALRRRRERTPTLDSGFDVLPGRDPDVAVAFDLDARLAVLREGDPRNAIVACWSQLEQDAAAVGLPRMAAETSLEYTQRVFAAAEVDRAATLELAELYREARFSDHPVENARRARAVDALQRIHASLRVRTPDAAGRPA